MALSGNSKPEEFLLFVQNFKIMLDKSGMLASNEKLQYITG